MESQLQDREWTRPQGWISLIRSLSASPGWKKPAILVLVLGVRAGGLGESLGVELPPPDTYRLVKGLLWSLAPSPALTFLWDFWTLPPASAISAPLGCHSIVVTTGGGKCQGLRFRAPGRGPGSVPTSGLIPAKLLHWWEPPFPHM